MDHENNDQRLVGSLEHNRVGMQWTFHEDNQTRNDRSKQWLVKVSLGDISVTCRYPVVLSAAEAHGEANKIAPDLLQVAGTWLNSAWPR